MLSLTDLLQFARQQGMPVEKRRGILREYLQTLVLFYLQQSILVPKLIFIGGTALRFFYDLPRFSEDLDFNYRGTLTRQQLQSLSVYIQRSLLAEKIKMDFVIHKSHETYCHWKIYLKFPDILQAYGCSGKKTSHLHPAEILSLQMDFQNFGRKTYPLEPKLIAKFGKRFLFNTTTLNMFLAEKSNAMFFRKSPRGRDLFDFMLIWESGGRLDLALLKKRDVIVTSTQEYFSKLKKRIDRLNFTKLTDQLAPFLFNPNDLAVMRNFGLVVEKMEVSNRKSH